MDRRSLIAPAVPARQLLEVLESFRRDLHPDLVLRRAAAVRLIREREGELWFARPTGCDLMSEVTWDERMPELQVLGKIYTLHFYNFQGRFTATWEEVFAMVPEHVLGQLAAIEIIGPVTDEDRLRQAAAREAGLLVALTVLYTY